MILQDLQGTLDGALYDFLRRYHTGLIKGSITVGIKHEMRQKLKTILDRLEAFPEHS